MSDHEALGAFPWRTGRKVGRTMYAQRGPEPSDSDPLIGMMDTPELAAEACASHNAMLSRGRPACPKCGTSGCLEDRALDF